MAINIIKHTSNIREPAWSPVANQIVFKDYYENLYTVEADGETPKKLINNGGATQWSPDGSFIYYVSLSGNEIGKINTKTFQSEFIYQAEDIQQFALSRSGEKIVVTHKDRLVIMESNGSSVRNVIDSTSKFEFPNYENLSWSFDDNWLVVVASIERSYHILVINPGTGDKKTIYENGHQPTCSPVSSLVAFLDNSSKSKNINFWDLSTEQLRKVKIDTSFTKSQSVYGNYSWSPNGKFIAFVRREKGYALCLLSVADEKIIPVIKFDDGMNQETFSKPAWSPDNKKIAVTLSPDFSLHVITL